MHAVLRPTLVVFTALTLLTGVLYPLAVTGVGQTAFPQQAAASLVLRDGQPIGSALISHPFSTPQFFL